MTYADGSTYSGEWKLDKRNGMGSLQNAQKETMHGTWANGVLVAQVIEDWQEPDEPVRNEEPDIFNQSYSQHDSDDAEMAVIRGLRKSNYDRYTTVVESIASSNSK